MLKNDAYPLWCNASYRYPFPPLPSGYPYPHDYRLLHLHRYCPTAAPMPRHLFRTDGLAIIMLTSKEFELPEQSGQHPNANEQCGATYRVLLQFFGTSRFETWVSLASPPLPSRRISAVSFSCCYSFYHSLA